MHTMTVPVSYTKPALLQAMPQGQPICPGVYTMYYRNYRTCVRTIGLGEALDEHYYWLYQQQTLYQMGGLQHQLGGQTAEVCFHFVSQISLIVPLEYTSGYNHCNSQQSLCVHTYHHLSQS